MKRYIKTIPMILLSMILCILPVFAMAEVDVTKTGTVILTGYPPEGAELRFYKVADADKTMVFTLTPKFAPYADQITVNVEDREPYDGSTSQAVWAETAKTLASIVPGDSIEPDVTFMNSGEQCVAADLPVGLYLVLSDPIEVDNDLYYTLPMLISVPTNISDGKIPYIGDTEKWFYDYEVNMKYKKEQIPPREYRVLKVWVNDGEGKKRPASLEVQILKNNTVVETVVLNSSNNWSYTWMGEKNARYSVREVKVPDGYKVSYEDQTTVFTIRNRFTEPPDTSDHTDLKWPMMGLCIGGLIALLAGIVLLRDRKQTE